MSSHQRIKQLHQAFDDMLQLQLDQAVEHLLQGPKYQNPKNLNRYEHKVFSQSGEDGIIAEVFRRIGTTNKVFVECAPGDGIENNTLYLLTVGWKGLWIERNPKHLRAISKNFMRRIKEGHLSVAQQPAVSENIESLFRKASIPLEFDLLSLDIDGNDYWVWNSLAHYRPRVITIEYNAIFPPGCQWVMPYDPRAEWDGSSNFGASLTSLESLGIEKGYKLVGCTLAGTNAFFVREELVEDRFPDPFTANHHYEPPRYYLTARKAGHRRTAPTHL